MSKAQLTSPDVLARIERETFVRRAEFHERIGSTNDRAMELAGADETPIPHLILAAEQTAGRGRGANRWWSSDGALTFTLLLDWDATRSPLGTPGGVGSWPQISLAAALAVCEVIQTFLEGSVPPVPCGIRWPNDVHAGGKKICGVLPEVGGNKTEPAGARLVLGMGINVNNRLADAPPDIQAVGTSLCELVGSALDPAEVLVRILKGIDRNLQALERADPWLPQQWGRNCLLTGKTVELSLGPRSVRGICRGIDADGALLLHQNGTTERFHGGVIANVR